MNAGKQEKGDRGRKRGVRMRGRERGKEGTNKISPSSLPLPFLFPRAFLGVRKEGRGSQQNKRRKGSFPPFLSSSSLTRCSPLIRLTTDRGCDERSCTHMLCRTVLRSTTTSPLNGEDEGILRATQTSLAFPATKIRNIRMKQQEKNTSFHIL